VIDAYRTKIESLEEDIKAIEREEAAEKEMMSAQAQLSRAERQLDGSAEAEQKRQWFETHRERMENKEELRLGTFEKLPQGKKNKQQKIAEFGKRAPKTVRGSSSDANNGFVDG